MKLCIILNKELIKFFRICRLLDGICTATDESAFFCALWRCVLGSPDVRLPAVTFVLSKLNKKLTAEDQVYCLGGHLPLVVSCSALLLGRNFWHRCCPILKHTALCWIQLYKLMLEQISVASFVLLGHFPTSYRTCTYVYVVWGAVNMWYYKLKCIFSVSQLKGFYSLTLCTCTCRFQPCALLFTTGMSLLDEAYWTLSQSSFLSTNPFSFLLTSPLSSRPLFRLF